ncbi:MAG: hypothetical protein OEW87_13285, partial [Flavobacteriaceae bacterium]|nr:hypothetical protein [Flavobacteriaceae bacterium]
LRPGWVLLKEETGLRNDWNSKEFQCKCTRLFNIMVAVPIYFSKTLRVLPDSSFSLKEVYGLPFLEVLN